MPPCQWGNSLLHQKFCSQHPCQYASLWRVGAESRHLFCLHSTWFNCKHGRRSVTINILTLAAANTLHIQVDFGTALILSVVAAISACGASGVAGGSLLLIPVACSLFGITNDLAMQVVSVGFIIGSIQDLLRNSPTTPSTDVLFTATRRNE